MYWSGARNTDMPSGVLGQLSVLSVMHCDLEDLFACHLSPRLEDLYLNDVALPTLSVLEGLTRLRRLDLSNNGLRSLDGLPAFRRLVSLSVANNKLISLERVTASDGIAELYAAHNNLTDLRCISSLCALNRLTVLSLAGNPLTEEDCRLYVL
jgi:Leucine-rich repeat (LRR) protein